jgi:hypothetical protein
MRYKSPTSVILAEITTDFYLNGVDTVRIMASIARDGVSAVPPLILPGAPQRRTRREYLIASDLQLPKNTVTARDCIIAMPPY